jgi:hypothetical protein
MRYADSLLTEGETVVLRTRQHWLALIVRSKAALLLWLAGAAIFIGIVALNVQDRGLRDILSLVAIVLIALGLVVFLYRLWHWWAQDYMITNRRLLKVTGILNKRSSDSSLEKINDAVLNQPLLGRMLGYGDLEILTAADQANDLYHMLKDPKQFKKVMLTQKHALETDFAYASAMPPTPPFRVERDERPMSAPQPMQSQPVMATAGAGAMAPAPSPLVDPVSEPTVTASGTGASAAAPATEPDDESLEITQTLARLADLRDSGAITAEEYEQKKDDLLSRL